MKTTDLLAAVLAIKELEVKTLRERIAHLESANRCLSRENDELYAQIAHKDELLEKVKTQIGFKSTKNEKEKS